MKFGNLMVRNSFCLLSASGFNLIVSILTTSAIAKTIGTELFGKYTFGLSFIVLFSVLANFGLESLFVREAARDKANIKKLIYDVLAIKCLLAAMTVAVLIGFAHGMAYDESTIAVIKILSAGLFFQIASEVLGAVYRSLERLHFISLCTVLFRAITALIIFISIYSGVGFWGIVWSYTIGRIIVFLFICVHYQKTIGIGPVRVNIRFWPELIRRGLPFYLSAIFTMLYMKVTVLFLAETHGEHEIGIYMAAAILVESLLFLPNSFSMILFSAFSRIYGNSLEALKKAYARSMKYIVILIAAVVTGTILISEKLILLIYGEEFQGAPTVLNILVLFWGLAFLTQIMSNLLFAINRERLQVKIMGVTCISNILLNIILVPVLGAVGSAIAFTVSEVIAVSLIMIFLWQLEIKYFPVKLMARLLPVILVMTTVVLAAEELNILISVFLGALSFIISLLIFRVFDEEDIRYLLQIFRRSVPPMQEGKITRL
jgi:O-antigen/teichoic acid export membrane protein